MHDFRSQPGSPTTDSERCSLVAEAIAADLAKWDRPDAERRDLAEPLDPLREEVVAATCALGVDPLLQGGALGSLAGAVEVARGRWDLERRALTSQADRLRRERDEAASDSQKHRDRLRRVLKRARRAIVQVACEQDEVLHRAEEIGEERDRWIARCEELTDRSREVEAELTARAEELDARLRELDDRYEEERARLVRELELARARKASSTRYINEQAEQIQQLQAEVVRLRAIEAEQIKMQQTLTSELGRAEADRLQWVEEVNRLQLEAHCARQQRDAALGRAEVLGRERAALAARCEELEAVVCSDNWPRETEGDHPGRARGPTVILAPSLNQ